MKSAPLAGLIGLYVAFTLVASIQQRKTGICGLNGVDALLEMQLGIGISDEGKEPLRSSPLSLFKGPFDARTEGLLPREISVVIAALKRPVGIWSGTPVNETEGTGPTHWAIVPFFLLPIQPPLAWWLH